MSKFNTYIEICEMPEGELAGRTKIKMSALEVYSDANYHNANGITWLKQYIEDNIASAIGMPFVVSWLDEELQIPSDHGTMSVDDEGNIEFDGVAVGSVQDAKIGIVNIDGIDKDALICEGFLYNQRYPLFVDWLKESLKNGENIKGSIEINGKGTNKNIVYLDGSINEDGTLKMGRIPTEFDFSGLAILYMCQPSDNTSQVIEINNNQEDEVKKELGKQTKEKVIARSKSFEINELSYDDIATIVCRAFNATMNIKNPDEYSYYYPYKFYPQSQTVIMTDYGTPQEYYKTSYNITNNDVTIGDIVEVDMSWTPSNEDDVAVEINISLIEDIININKKVEKNSVSDKAMKKKMMDMSEEEMNSMISGMTEDEKTKMVSSMSDMIKNMQKGGTMMEANEQLIQELNSKVEELTAKMVELNTAIVEANKAIESKEVEVTQITEELNSLKAFKEAKDIEAKNAEVNAKIAELNTYFETEIKKNGFTEAEINSLKEEYVDKNDLAGLKAKEAELCVKRVKELNSVQKSVELNATDNGDLFMAIHNTEKVTEDYSDLF